MPKASEWLLGVVTIFAIVLAAIHMFVPDEKMKIDAVTLGLVAVALVPQVLPYFESITLPDGTKLSLRQQMVETEKRLDLIEERGALPGRSEITGKETKLSLAEGGSPNDDWNSDPNKNAFGGSPAANGRVLEASIKPAAGSRSAACKVKLSVRSTDPARPLEGTVEFHLHPSFGRWARYQIPVKGGVATDTVTCWGVFTVGAVADGGATRLELDLLNVPGGSDKFYDS